MTSRPSTEKPSEDSDEWKRHRDQIIGLGERSFRKSYYPELRQNLDRLGRFRALLDHTTDFVLLLTLPQGIVSDANAALARLLGRDSPQLIEQPFATLGFKNAEALIATLENDRLTGSSETHYLLMEVTRADGRAQLIDLSYRIAHIEQTSHGVLVGRDAAPRLAAELEVRMLNESLEHRVKARTQELETINRELESFCYSVSHDLRGPLRALNGFAHLIHEQDADRLSEESQKMLERIRANAERMGILIDGLLQFSRVGRNEMIWRPVDLAQLVRSIVGELQHEYPRSRIVVNQLPQVVGDETLLRQALENLIANACKFSAKLAQPMIEIGMTASEPDPVIHIRDNGAGFDMAYAGKLFGVFQRLHRESDFPGTGAGLAIVKRIIERHDGRIWAESQPDQGACFYFTLPATN